MGDRASFVAAGRPAATDKAWNMLCLNPLLHRWWGEARFALKCLGVHPKRGIGTNATDGAVVSIQFVWMAQKTLPADIWRSQLCMDAGEGEAWLEDYGRRPRYGTPGIDHDHSNDHDQGVVAAIHARTGRPLRSGSTVSVVLPSLADALNMKAVLDLQWTCINLASMSGAAESADFLERDEFYGLFAGLVGARMGSRYDPQGE